MDPAIQAKFKPVEVQAPRDFSDAKVSTTATAKAIDSTDKNKANFRDLLLNSNDDMSRQRTAQKNGDQLRMAKTDEEFAKAMLAKANQQNLRKPQNELDKEAFLKLFVTQMRNQDPLNPDNSAQMAAQLAQFHGLEQMMNVNKNLEKMQSEEALGRAVGLINFVGKDIKLDNGKLLVENGKIVADATFKLDTDVAKATVEMRDAAGAVVATHDLGPLNAGEHKLEWEGRGADGKPIENGAYTFAIVASDGQGTMAPAKIMSSVSVTGVDLHDGGGAFFTPVGKVRINEVASVGETGFVKAAKTPLKSKQDTKGSGSESEGSPKTQEAATAAPSPDIAQAGKGDSGQKNKSPERPDGPLQAQAETPRSFQPTQSHDPAIPFALTNATQASPAGDDHLP